MSRIFQSFTAHCTIAASNIKYIIQKRLYKLLTVSLKGYMNRYFDDTKPYVKSKLVNIYSTISLVFEGQNSFKQYQA